VKVGGDTIVVGEFACLGICITKYRDELKDVKRRIGLASNAYHSLLPIMKSREVHSQTKIKVYKTLIKSRSEVWALSQTVEKMLTVLERKVLKKICGPVFVYRQWQNKYNHEIYKVYK
jgi:hypothetical protein